MHLASQTKGNCLEKKKNVMPQVEVPRLFPEILQHTYYTETLLGVLSTERGAGFVPGTTASAVWSATNGDIKSPMSHLPSMNIFPDSPLQLLYPVVCPSPWPRPGG